MKNLINLFTQLVQIDSPSGHEEKMSLFLQKWLKKNNFQFKIDSVGNIYATNEKGGAPLLLSAHMDTVQPGENIKPIVKNGIIKSLGDTILGADNKAALAAIMSAVEANNTHHLELLFTVKEETGGGVEHFPFEWIKSKLALVFDSAHPLGGIVLASPYICNFYVTLFGKAVHSSTPQNGINAFVPGLQALQKIAVGNLDKRETTINIGLINGGIGINTIPDKISISGEIRSYDKKLFTAHQKNIQNIFENESIKYQVKCDFTTDGYCTGYSFQKTNPFIEKIVKIYAQEGLKTQYYGHSGISDANVLNEHGIKTVNLTDGVKHPHTTDEQITVKDLKELSEIIKKCIAKL